MLELMLNWCWTGAGLVLDPKMAWIVLWAAKKMIAGGDRCIGPNQVPSVKGD